MRIDVELAIGAEADEVWRALTDFEAYESWNPFVVRAAPIKERVFCLWLEFSPEERYMSVEAVVETSAPPQELSVRFLLYLIPGVVEARYSADLSVVAGGVVLRQAVAWQGLLRKAYIHKSFMGRLERRLQVMAKVLKERCEAV